MALKTALETAFILTVYVVSVLAWRNNWTPAKGMTAKAAFMPIVGHVNAEFLSESLWLEFLIVVIPIVCVLSGFLAPLLDRMQEAPQLRRNTEAKTYR